MVSFISKGRCGNFHFIAAAAYVYAMRNHQPFHSAKHSLAPSIWPVYLEHLQNPAWNPELETMHVDDEGHPYKYLPYDKCWDDKNVILGTPSITSGYFQSWRYTNNRTELIRSVFGYRFWKQYGTVAIHVRRGDYLNFPDKHPTIPERYIIGCIEKLRSSGVRVYKYKFFSDDIPWCKEFHLEYEPLFTGYKVEFSTGTELEDLEEIMNAEFSIISNSSFSLFAAMLNPHKNKVVFCPHEDNWYGENNKHLDVSTMIPPSFNRVKY